MSDAAGIVVLAGRLLFALFFGVVAGLGGHVKMGKMMEGYAKQMNFPLAPIAGWPTGLWLFAGALSIALGVWPDLGSLMIIAFLVPAGAYFHRFWEIEDAMQKMNQQLFFWRNVFGIGACLVFFGTFVALGPELRYAITGPLFDF
jgi:putative oxidoreductase